MASKFLDKGDVHWDATCGTVEDEFGEIPGVITVAYSGGTRTRGRVVAVGSRFPVGYTPGDVVPGEARLTMNRRDAVAWYKLMADREAPGRVGDKRRNFKIVYAPLDEEGSQLPAEVDTFDALVDPPEGLGFDRNQGSQPLTVEIKLFVVGPIKYGGVRVEG